MAKIQFLGGERHGMEKELPRAGLTLGTAADLEIDADGVAPVHARIYEENDAYWIEGLRGQTVFVNFRKTGKTPLSDRDVVIMGRAAFRFLEEVEARIPLREHERIVAAKDKKIASLKAQIEGLQDHLRGKDAEIEALDRCIASLQDGIATLKAFGKDAAPRDYAGGEAAPVEPEPD